MSNGQFSREEKRYHDAIRQSDVEGTPEALFRVFRAEKRVKAQRKKAVEKRLSEA